MPPEDPDLVERAPPPATPPPVKAQQAQLELCVRTKAALVPIPEPRSSVNSSSDTGAPGSTDSWGGTDFGGQSFTSPSLKQQRQRGLSAIAESPTCMLNTADIEWCPMGSALSSPPPFLNAPQPPPLSAEGGPLPGGGVAEGGQGVRAGQAAATDKGASGAPSKFQEEELKCPICLDVMYKPVGLGCGHKFCRQCALEAAGFGKAIGAFHNICSHVPLRAGCPQCRQTGVYRDAVALREVGHLIQTRYPDDWAERRREEKERCKAISSEAARRQRELLQAQSPIDLLFSF